MGAALSHGRKTRKSMPTRPDVVADQENEVTSAKATASLAFTPQSTRRDRKSRPANTGAKINKPSPVSKNQSTPATSTTKAKLNGNGVVDTTPATNTSTRPRRRDRHPAKAADEELLKASNETGARVTPTKNAREPNHEALENNHTQSPNKKSNTVTLNVGRKLIDILNEAKAREAEAQEAREAREAETAANMDIPGHAENGDYHIDYDSAMYKNNYGLDGHVDSPTSPTSLSTTTSNAARTSGRARKPTTRALESFESEQQYRRPRAPSVKLSNTTDAIAGKTRSKQQRSAEQSPTSSLKSAHKPDVFILAKQIYELAAAAVAPDFVSPPEVDIWIQELHQKLDEGEKEKEQEKEQEREQEQEQEQEQETVVAQSVEEVEEDGGGEEEEKDEEEKEEEADPSDNPFLDNVQTSDPWIDDDGWEHTGQHNKHGEEFVIVPSGYEYYRPNNTYGDDQLPLPPVRLRSLIQAEKDRAFGYPPRIGDRNLPVDYDDNFFLFENVLEEKLKLKIREDSRGKGIYVHRFMSFEELEKLQELHEKGQPAVLPLIDNTPVEVKPTRKRRRAEPSRLSISVDDTETQRPKRRRHEANNAAHPELDEAEPSTEEPISSERKNLTITLKFKHKQRFSELVRTSEAKAAATSKKRPRSEAEEPFPEKPHSHDTRSPKLQKTAAREQNIAQAAPSTPAKAADKTEKPNTPQETPGSADAISNEATPGGRPRRRAADALMAGFQRHAEDRARRAERARLGHARRKGTPLKTVTGVHGDTVESPIRPVNPMNVD
ncbi:hypothetical protein BJX70DRAFT_394678 [Aspergillus crustosus]